MVIVGASGNVGTALLRRLAGVPEIDEIVGVARRMPAPTAPYQEARWETVDIGGPDAVSRLTEVFRGAAAVVHLGWQIQPSQQPRRLHRTNVEGSRNVALAVLRAGVPSLVYASSVGAYEPGPKDRTVGESWPVGGVAGSMYSQQKARVEALLDDLEDEHPDLRVVRLRPALIFQHDAGGQIARYFLGPLVPVSLLKARRLPLVPFHETLRAQCVHAADVAEAYARAILSDVRGPFNVAAEPVLDGRVASKLFGGRPVRVPPWLLTWAAGASWLARLQPTDPGWIWLATHSPLLDSTRARVELGWAPQFDALTALTDLVDGMASGAGTSSPALRPRSLTPGTPPGHGSLY